MGKGTAENLENTTVTVFCKNNKMLRENGVSFHWWNSKSTTLHTHDFCEIFIITAGEAIHTLNGETGTLERGTIHFIKPDDVHLIRASKEKGCVHMNLCIGNDKMEQILNVLNIDAEAFYKSKKMKTVLSADELNTFIKQAEKINLMNIGDETGSAVLICELAVRAVSMIYNSQRNVPMNYPKWFSAMLEKIHSPENIGIGVCDVYAMGDFSPPVMIKYFKRYTGKTVNAYLRDMKCDHACTLLETTTLSTLDISTSLGYYSLSHFNRIFKEYTGISPAAYRKKFLTGTTEIEKLE